MIVHLGRRFHHIVSQETGMSIVVWVAAHTLKSMSSCMFYDLALRCRKLDLSSS